MYNKVCLFSIRWKLFSSQAIDSIHQVGLYCLALVPANTLPKTPLGGIHICETKQNFLEGNLHPCNILMCPHTCVTNMPKPRQKQPGGPPGSISADLHSITSETCYYVVGADGVMTLILLWSLQWMLVLLLCWSATWWQGSASPRLRAESWEWWRTRI